MSIRTLIILALLSTPALAQRDLYTVFGDSPNDAYGQSIDMLGDVNRDGFADFLVGAWRDDDSGLPDAGSVWVYSGIDGSLLFRFPGTGANDHMGYGSSGAGDVNGDGYADILAAADEDNVGGLTNAGSAQIHSGFDGSILHNLEGDSANELFGWSTAALGDVNGDGFDDVAIGTLNDDDPVTGFNDAGSVSVYSGIDGALLYRFYGERPNHSFGADVGRAGDVNNDGYADIIASGFAAPRVRVFSGLDGSELYGIAGSNGSDVSGGVDCNGDGYDDFIIGRSSRSAGRGEVTVYSGFDGAILHTFTGDDINDNLGADVRGAGDLDGDGYGDVVAGATGDDDNGNSSGSVRGFSGRDGRVLFTFYGDNPGDRLGTSVSGGGDTNGDGFPEIVAGGLGFDGGGNNSGGARVFEWIPDGLESFGTGTPGCQGDQLLGTDGVPRVGATIELLSGHGPSSEIVMLLVSDAGDRGGVPLPGLGVLWHVAFPPISTFFLTYESTTDISGSARLPLSIPDQSSLIGQTFYFQALFSWPGGCMPYSSSRGLSMTIQP